MSKIMLVITILSVAPDGNTYTKRNTTEFSTVAECHKVLKDLGFPKPYPSYITAECVF